MSEQPNLHPERRPIVRVRNSRRPAAPTASSRRPTGQTLVEFAFVFPLVITLVLGIVEFAFIFEATLAINFASRNASLAGAEGGSNQLSDCAILARVEQDVSAPLDKNAIQSVTIFKADRFGKAVSPPAQNAYARTPGTPMTCTGFTPSSVPYSLAAAPNNSYPVGAIAAGGGRCDILAGCSSTVPLDSIGVTIVYRYSFHTPLRNFVAFLPGASGGYFDVTWSNVMRMEPIL